MKDKITSSFRMHDVSDSLWLSHKHTLFSAQIRKITIMELDILENVYLLVIVTLLSVLQNAFFAQKVEQECKTHNSRSFLRPGTPAFERVYCANPQMKSEMVHLAVCFINFLLNGGGCQNCMDAYPTFLAVLWCAGICCSQAPAAFSGLMYLFVRQKYFVGYMGETSQSTPGYLFGKRIISFLFLMSVVGILNYFLLEYFGSDYKEYIQTIMKASSALLLIP